MPNDYWPIEAPDDYEGSIPYWFHELVWEIYSSLPGASEYGFTPESFYEQFQNYFPAYSPEEADYLAEMLDTELESIAEDLLLWETTAQSRLTREKEARQLALDDEIAVMLY